jgi:hypothetical protein
MFSQFVRRSHLYLALFLSPWLLMYALSTMAMNHRGFFVERHGGGPVLFHPERELAYDGVFSAEAAPRDIARQVLASLGLEGAHTANRRADGTIVINRQDLTTPRRITYTPADSRLVIEKMEPRAHALLERFHRRRGYETGYTLDTAWAVTVDLTIAAMILWAASGLWMWWEMKATRRAGAVAGLAGLAVFALYVFTI